nr:unnamed protein product [Digitaria exilis]
MAKNFNLAVPNLSRRVAPSPSRRRIPSASILPLHRRRVPSASSPPPTQPRSGPLRLHPLPRFAARLSPRERWTADEHDRFLHALVLFGRVWKRIEAFVVLVTSTQPRPEALPKVSELGLPTPAPHPRRAAVVTDAVTPSDETLIRDVFSHREALGHHDARPPPQRPRPPRCRPPGKNHIKMAPGQNRGRSKPPTAGQFIGLSSSSLAAVGVRTAGRDATRDAGSAYAVRISEHACMQLQLLLRTQPVRPTLAVSACTFACNDDPCMYVLKACIHVLLMTDRTRLPVARHTGAWPRDRRRRRGESDPAVRYLRLMRGGELEGSASAGTLSRGRRLSSFGLGGSAPEQVGGINTTPHTLPLISILPRSQPTPEVPNPRLSKATCSSSPTHHGLLLRPTHPVVVVAETKGETVSLEKPLPVVIGFGSKSLSRRSRAVVSRFPSLVFSRFEGGASLLLLNWVLFVGVNAAFMEKLMARGRTGVDAAVADVANPNSNSHGHGRLHVFMYPDHLVVRKMPEEHSATHVCISFFCTSVKLGERADPRIGRRLAGVAPRRCRDCLMRGGGGGGGGGGEPPPPPPPRGATKRGGDQGSARE